MANKIYLSSKTNWIEDDGTNTVLFVDSAVVITIHNATGAVTLGDVAGTGTINLFAALITSAFGLAISGTSNFTADVVITGTTISLRFPNMTSLEKGALTNAKGKVIFDTTLNKLCVNNGSAWETITST